MKAALVLIDIQNDYFEGGAMELSGSEAACKNAGRLLDYHRTNGLPIIHVQHIASRPAATFFRPNTPGAEIHHNVRPLPQEKIVVKHFPNSFKDTDLLTWLKDGDIAELVFCGMMTHMCVDATVRAAKDFGFECTLIADACATRNLDVKGFKVKAADVHQSFIAALSYFYATIKDTEEYIKSI